MSYSIADIEKRLKKAGISTGLSNPTHWLSTGNFALNYIMSGRFHVGIPNRRSVMYWGPSGSGKSYFAMQAAVEAQKQGYLVWLIDTETAQDESYIDKCGLDRDPKKFYACRASTLEEVTKIMQTIFESFAPEEKVFVLLDSLSMLETQIEADKFDKGELHSDMGLFPKRLKAMMKNINVKVGDRDMYFVATNHAYVNQDLKNGKGTHIPTGGEGFIFVPSISVMLKAFKLKDESNLGQTLGVRIKAEITKSRYNKFGGKVEMPLPYEEGIREWDGLMDLLKTGGLITQNGGWNSYVTSAGETVKFQKKDFHAHYRAILQLDELIAEFGDPEEAE